MISGEITGVNVPIPEQFGFCEGVEAADTLLKNVSQVAGEFGVANVYGYHEIVHNKTVIQAHEQNGVAFVSNIEEIPKGSIVVGSAHGSSPTIPWQIQQNGGLFIDGACPLVIKSHKAVQQARINDEKVIYLLSGKPNAEATQTVSGGQIHDEVLGTVGHMDYYLDEGNKLVQSPLKRSYVELSDDPSELENILDPMARYRIVGQTTLLATACLSFRGELASAIIAAQPEATIGRIERRDVCFAVEDRQEGVRLLLSKKPDSVVVVTDPKSKNGKGYFTLAQDEVLLRGLETSVVAIKSVDDLPDVMDQIRGRVAVTASASTPDSDTRAVVQALGGDGSLVPNNRPAFTLHGSRVDQIRASISKWMHE